MTEESDDVEDVLRRQDEAMALLERLRLAEPVAPSAPEPAGGGRRDFRRWPMPDGIRVELHDGEQWHTADCLDLGIGGVRLRRVPSWVQGPVPARLKSDTSPSVLVLADVMWRDGDGGGVKFEFGDTEERDQWTATLIDALLARYSLG